MKPLEVALCPLYCQQIRANVARLTEQLTEAEYVSLTANINRRTLDLERALKREPCNPYGRTPPL